MPDAREPEREPESRSIRALPEFDPEMVERCRDRGEPMPLMFEWFKHVALLAIDVAATSPSQPGHLPRDRVHLGVLRGLLNRCARLMLSTVKLAHERRGGESVALLARCIAESALTAQWLIRKMEDDSFARYVGYAIRTDLKLKEVIDSNIAERGGEVLVIEERMLRSIERVASRAGTTVEAATATKKMPDIASMIRDLGYPDQLYVTVQRIGSHAVHGSWTDLLFHYIEEQEDGSFTMTDTVDSVPHPNQLSMTALLVLDTMRSHSTFILHGAPVLDALRKHFDQVQSGVLAAQELGRESDLEPIEGS
jgi:hypothetical protein